MSFIVQALVSITARIFLSLIFILSAIGNKIPNYNAVADVMGAKGVPLPSTSLAAAIGFLILGGTSVIVGYKARLGALLLLIFLGLATYYFHDFWNFPEEEQQAQIIQVMKNLALGGAMLFIMANGPGAGSLDGLLGKEK